MQASDELDESQARQLSFDLESAYNDFNKILHSSWEAQDPLATTCIIVSSLNTALPPKTLELDVLVDYYSHNAAKNCDDLLKLCKQHTITGSLV